MLEQFKQYVDSFNSCDAIKYKYIHSIKVMNLSEQLGKNLNIKGLELVKLIGLLHDYARFTQWDKYKSFNDLKTFDHGDEAVKILFEQKEIEKYNVKKEQYQIIKDAIKYHNKYEIGNVNNESLIYCQIIRDADKLDIISNFTKGIFKDNDGDFIHDEIKEQFFNHTQVKTLKDSTTNDKLIIMLALIYDLNFIYSFKYLKEYKIIENIKKQVDKETFEIYFNEIEKYTEQKLKEKKYVR